MAQVTERPDAPVFKPEQLEYLEGLFGKVTPRDSAASINEAVLVLGFHAEAAGQRKLLDHIRSLIENQQGKVRSPHVLPT